MSFCISPWVLCRERRDAWQVIRETVLTFNFNQTGIYMMADFWLLKLFGASAFALRLPSLLSAAWLLIAAASVLTMRGFGNLWKLVVVLAILAQAPLMNYAAEARPYMPLAAAAVGTLAFYLAAPDARRGWTLVLGALSVELGALVHPYFPGYWAIIICIGFTCAFLDGRCRLHIADFIRFCDLRLVALGLTSYAAVGALTWMRGAPDLRFDPFQWVHRDALVNQFLNNSHLSFIYWVRPRYLVLILMTVVALCSVLLPRSWRLQAHALLPPLLLALAALIASATLSWISYQHHYWILDRQWVASLGLMPVAVVWYAAELGRIADKLRPGSSVVLAAVCLAGFYATLHGLVPEKVALLWHDANRPMVTRRDCAGPGSYRQRRMGSARQCEHRCRGPVWPMFAKYYGR